MEYLMNVENMWDCMIEGRIVEGPRQRLWSDEKWNETVGR